MKRLLAVAVFAGLLSACAGVIAPGAAKSETTRQSLSATGKAMGALKSARFAVNGTITVKLPQGLADQLKARAGSQAGLLSSMSVALTIKGAAQRPDQLQATVSAKLGGLTIQTEVIGTGGNLYYKDPMTGKWEILKRAAATESTGSAAGKLSYQTLLDTATSITEINDPSTSINGTDHYRVVPDLVKLFDQVSAGQASSHAAVAGILRSVLQNAMLTADVWTGTTDHLIRRLSYDANVSADLSQLAAAIPSKPSAKTPALSLPAGSVAQVTAKIVIDLSDFNTQLKIEAPTVTG
jgi:LppX_LprAFG lipoprotein